MIRFLKDLFWIVLSTFILNLFFQGMGGQSYFGTCLCIVLAVYFWVLVIRLILWIASKFQK